MKSFKEYLVEGVVVHFHKNGYGVSQRKSEGEPLKLVKLHKNHEDAVAHAKSLEHDYHDWTE